MKKIWTLTAVLSILGFLLAAESFAQPAKGMKWEGSGGWGIGTQFGWLQLAAAISAMPSAATAEENWCFITDTTCSSTGRGWNTWRPSSAVTGNC